MPFSRYDCVIAAHGAGMVVAVAEFAVEMKRLYAALTDPGEIARWWPSPDGGPAVQWEGVPTPGLPWRAVGLIRHGRPFTAFGHFLEVDPPRRLVLSWYASWDDLAPTEVSLRFEPLPIGSALTLVHQGYEGRRKACMRQGRVWWRMIKRLHAHLGAGPGRSWRDGARPPRQDAAAESRRTGSAGA